MTSALVLLFVHVVASDVIFLILSRLLRGLRRPTSLRVFVLTRGLGPAAISLVCYLLLVFLPGRDRAIYLLLTILIFTLPGLLLWRGMKALGAAYRQSWKIACGVMRRPQGLAVVAALFLLAGLIFGVVYPIVEHDALAAAIEARIALRDSSFENYLAIQAPDPETGYFMTTFRIPFLQSLYVFLGWGAGSSSMDWLARTTSPIFAVHGLLLLVWAVRRAHSARAAAWASFLLAVTPIFFDMSYNNGIDTVRLYLVLVALLWLVELACSASSRLAVATGLVSGLALFCHVLAAPTLAGGLLAYLLAGSEPRRRRVFLVGLISIVAFLSGAQAHYLARPSVVTVITSAAESQKKRFDKWNQARMSAATGREEEEVALDMSATRNGSTTRDRQADSTDLAPALADPDPGRAAASPAAGSTPGSQGLPPPGSSRPGPSPPQRSRDHRDDLLERRGQGHTARSELLFGRLQMFTGIEYFGWVFYLFGASIWLWISERGKRTLVDQILLGSALLTVVVVLSGLRQLSWSNPRYIASLLPVAVYFVAPVMARFEVRHRLGSAVVAALLIFPVTIATSIRGAKLGITNSGAFYSDFRSFEWLGAFLDHPSGAVTTLWREYSGFRRSLSHLTSDRDTQLRQAHDYFAATLWARDHLPRDSHILVFRDARFFYYGERRATVHYSPEIDQKRFRAITTGPLLRDYLREIGLDHVLVDDVSTQMTGYADTAMGEILEDRRTARLLFEYGRARVYELVESGRDDPLAPNSSTNPTT